MSLYAKGITGTAEVNRLGRYIRSSFGSSGLFGDSSSGERIHFVQNTFDTFLKNKNRVRGEITDWGDSTIEPHEVEQALAIIEGAAKRYYITKEQLADFRKKLMEDAND